MKMLAYLCTGLLLGSVLYMAVSPMKFQWDFFVFYDAAQSLRYHLNPYQPSELGTLGLRQSPLSFTYPPLSILGFFPLAFLPPAAAAMLWFVLKCVLFVWFLKVTAFVHRFDWRNPLDSSLLFLGFNSTLLSDLGSGNTSIPQFLLVWSGIALFLRGKEAWSGLCLSASAFLKLQPLVLLFLLPLVRRPARWRALVIGLGIFALYIGANFLFFPEGSRAFLQEAMLRVGGERGIVSPSALALLQESLQMLGSVSYLAPWQDYFLGYARYYYVLFVLGFGGLSFALLWKNRSTRWLSETEAVCLGLLTYLAIIPRVKSYEFILALPIAGYVLARTEVKYRYALWLFLCLPVVYPLSPEGFLDLTSSAQLGPVKKVQSLFFHYLPYWQTLLLWGWFAQKYIRLAGGPSQKPSAPPATTFT